MTFEIVKRSTITGGESMTWCGYATEADAQEDADLMSQEDDDFWYEVRRFS